MPSFEDEVRSAKEGLNTIEGSYHFTCHFNSAGELWQPTDEVADVVEYILDHVSRWDQKYYQIEKSNGNKVLVDVQNDLDTLSRFTQRKVMEDPSVKKRAKDKEIALRTAQEVDYYWRTANYYGTPVYTWEYQYVTGTHDTRNGLDPVTECRIVTTYDGLVSYFEHTPGLLREKLVEYFSSY